MSSVVTPECPSCGCHKRGVVKRMYLRNKNSNDEWRYVSVGFLCTICNQAILDGE